MAPLKKSPAPAAAPEPYRVPALADLSIEFAALIQRRADLDNGLRALQREADQLRLDIAADHSPVVRPGVATLLGDDPVDGRAAKISRLAVVNREIADYEIAVGTIRDRIRAARGAASAAVCDAVRPEYARRVAAVVAALSAADVARASYEDLRNQFDSEDISWTSLGPLSLGFMGEHVHGRSARVAAVIKDSREAGYVL